MPLVVSSENQVVEGVEACSVEEEVLGEVEEGVGEEGVEYKILAAESVESLIAPAVPLSCLT